jgi:hypothetical protein
MPLLCLGCDTSRIDVSHVLDGLEGPAHAEPLAAIAPEDGKAGQRLMGTSAVTPHFVGRLLKVQACPTPPHLKLSASEWVWGAEIELEATSDERVPVNSFYARITFEGEPREAIVGGCTPELRFAPLHKGEKARGFANFVLPRSAAKLRLGYSPRVGRSRDEAEFDVGL